MAKSKTLSKLKQEVQIVFNAYIRKRDKHQPCISCNEPKPLQAGHYYPVSTHDGLRFNELNCHGECSYCNCFNEGHLIGYGKNLPDRIGIDKANVLEIKAIMYKQNGYRFTRVELISIKKKYQAKIKEL